MTYSQSCCFRWFRFVFVDLVGFVLFRFYFVSHLIGALVYGSKFRVGRVTVNIQIYFGHKIESSHLTLCLWLGGGVVMFYMYVWVS